MCKKERRGGIVRECVRRERERERETHRHEGWETNRHTIPTCTFSQRVGWGGGKEGGGMCEIETEKGGVSANHLLQTG